MAIKPRPLRTGATIGILSPSWPGLNRFRDRAIAAEATLRGMGFRVRYAKNAFLDSDYVAGSPERRAEDLHELFADRTVDGIVAAIGGNHSHHLLPLLDYELIAA